MIWSLAPKTSVPSTNGSPWLSKLFTPGTAAISVAMPSRGLWVPSESR